MIAEHLQAKLSGQLEQAWSALTADGRRRIATFHSAGTTNAGKNKSNCVIMLYRDNGVLPAYINRPAESRSRMKIEFNARGVWLL